MLNNTDNDLHNTLHDLLYETKVDIYDKKCSGCGFCRVEVLSHNVKNVFNDVHSALDSLSKMSSIWTVNRSCDYPTNVIDRNGNPRYPTLTEIVSNTCVFWDAKNIPSGEDDVFIEVTEYSTFEKPIIIQEFMSEQELSEQRGDREGISMQDIPQQESA